MISAGQDSKNPKLPSSKAIPAARSQKYARSSAVFPQPARGTDLATLEEVWR
jgi:hypothetical protein